MIGTADPSLDTPFIRPLEIVPTFSSHAPPSLPKTTRLHFLSPLWVCLQQVNWLLEVPEEISCSLKPCSLCVSGRFDFHEKANKPNPPKTGNKLTRLHQILCGAMIFLLFLSGVSVSWDSVTPKQLGMRCRPAQHLPLKLQLSLSLSFWYLIFLQGGFFKVPPEPLCSPQPRRHRFPLMRAQPAPHTEQT